MNHTEQSPETRLLTEVDRDLAVRAYEHISHRPNEHADMQCAYVAQHFVALRAELLIVGTNPAQLAVLDAEMPRYVHGYLTRFHAVLHVRASTVSPHIAGRSKFNAKRFERAMNAEQRAESDLAAFAEHFRAGMIDRLKAARTQAQRDEIAWSTLKRTVAECIGAVEGIDAGMDGWRGFERGSFVATASKSIRKAIAAGHDDAAAQALALVRSREEQGKRPLFGPAHPIWRDAAPVLAVAS